MLKCCQYTYPNGQCCTCGTQTTKGLEKAMTNVLELDTKRPHKSGYVVCGYCGHHWIGVAPVNHDPLECPKCRNTRGDFVDDLVTEAMRSIEALPPSEEATQAVVAIGKIDRFVRSLDGG